MNHWPGHHHHHSASPLHRLPAGLKLGAALAVIVGTVLMPWTWTAWFAGVAGGLIAAALLSQLPPWFLIKRLLLLSPFVLGVALLNAFEPSRPNGGTAVATRSFLCLSTVILVSNTTPFSQVLRVLQRVCVPGLLITTMALMHRYLFVLAEESARMRRARASRTFVRTTGFHWRTSSTVVAQLFVRASERAERIYNSMCARGWK